VAPSAPNSNNNDSIDNNSKNKTNFFKKIFKRKKKKTEIFPTNLDKIKENMYEFEKETKKLEEIKKNNKINQNNSKIENLNNNPFENNDNNEESVFKEAETHFLDKLDKVEEDLQLKKGHFVSGEILEKKENKSIEDISYSDDKKDDDSFNIDQLRKALGLIKDKSEKDVKIEEFKRSLFDKDKESSLVTNVSLENKLDMGIEGGPAGLIKDTKVGITMDTKADNKDIFVLSDGRKLQSLADLKDALENMNEIVFASHVSGRKNDFATWIKNSLGELALSKIVRKCKDINTLLSIMTALERKEINDLIKIKKKQILEEHQQALEDLNFINIDRQELTKEKRSIDSEKSAIDELKLEYEKKLEDIKEKENEFLRKIKETDIEKETAKEKESMYELEKEKYDKIINDTKIQLEKDHSLRVEQLNRTKEEFLRNINKQTTELETIRKALLDKTEQHVAQLKEEYNTRKEKLEKEYQEKFIEFEKNFDQRKKELSEDFKRKNDKLSQDKEDFRKEQAEINALYQTKLKEVKLEEKNIYELQKELKEQELRLIEKENEVRKKLSELSNRTIELRNYEVNIQKSMDKKNSKILELKQEEANLNNMKIQYEREGFQSYLDTKLKELASKSSNKKEEVKPVAIDSESKLEIYKLISDCKKLVDKDLLNEAKRVYKGIVSSFKNLTLPEDENKILVNAIKELYTDIEIKSI